MSSCLAASDQSLPGLAWYDLLHEAIQGATIEAREWIDGLVRPTSPQVWKYSLMAALPQIYPGMKLLLVEGVWSIPNDKCLSKGCLEVLALEDRCFNEEGYLSPEKLLAQFRRDGACLLHEFPQASLSLGFRDYELLPTTVPPSRKILEKCVEILPVQLSAAQARALQGLTPVSNGSTERKRL